MQVPCAQANFDQEAKVVVEYVETSLGQQQRKGAAAARSEGGCCQLVCPGKQRPHSSLVLSLLRRRRAHEGWHLASRSLI